MFSEIFFLDRYFRILLRKMKQMIPPQDNNKNKVFIKILSMKTSMTI